MALQVYSMAIVMVRGVSVIARKVERVDSDLCRQMRRAMASVPLNINEGTHSQGRNREARLYNSMGSAREVIACLDVAEAAGYVRECDVVDERKRLDEIVAMLWTLIHRRR